MRAETAPTVLVVDDEPAITAVVCEALAEAGLRAQGCTQAAEAFWFIQRTEPSLVILDVRMPGVDGISLLHQLRADPATVGLPVLFLTAHADEVAQRLPHYAALGAHVVAKPFALDHLLGLVQQTLAARASGGHS
jgi:DNA-binding response OmpR family regulator